MGDDSGRGARSAKTAPNPEHFRSAKKKYPDFNMEANTEYKRLDEINKKKPLTVGSKEHAIHVHLCTLKDGLIIHSNV